MKKLFPLLLSLSIICTLFSGCGNKESTKALKEYKSAMETFYSDIVLLDTEINSIDANSDDSLEQLYEKLDTMEQKITEMSKISVPTEDAPDTFIYIQALANESSTYMKQANEYFKQAYSDNNYNENVLNAAVECYTRANKRLSYIVDLIHGEYPKDDNISYGK